MAEGSLNNAEVIGGVVVTITAPIDELRASEASAKAIAKSISDLNPKIVATVDASKLKASFDQARTAIARGSDVVITANTSRVFAASKEIAGLKAVAQAPVKIVFDTAGAEQKIVGLRNEIKLLSTAGSGRLMDKIELRATAGAGSVPSAQIGFLQAIANDEQRRTAFIESLASKLEIIGPPRPPGKIVASNNSRLVQTGSSARIVSGEDERDESPAGAGAPLRRGRNLFSLRGLGSVSPLGVTGVFAAMEAARVAGGFLEASQIQSHPDWILESMRKTGDVHDVRADPVMQGISGRMATIEASQKRIATLEAVPLFGILASTADEIQGKSARLTREMNQQQRIAEGHNIAVKAVDEHAVFRAERAMVPMGAQVVAAQHRVQSLDQIKGDAIFGRVMDPARSLALAFAKEEQRVLELDQARLTAVQRNTLVARGNSLFVQSGEIGAEGRHDSLGAFDAKRKADRIDLIDDVNARRSTITDPGKRQQQFALDQKELANFDAQVAVDRKAVVVNLANDTKQLEAQAASDRLQIQHQGVAAEIVILNQERDAKLAVADASQRAAIIDASNARQQLIVAQQHQQFAANVTSAIGTIQAANARIAHDPYSAQRATFEANATNAINSVKGDPIKTAIVQTEVDANRRAMEAEHKFAIDEGKKDLDARAESAKLMAVGRREEAQAVREVRAAMNEVAHAAPEMRAAVKAATTAELSERLSNLTGSHGGAVVAATSDLGAAQAEVLEARAHAIDDQRARGVIGAALNNIPKFAAGATVDRPTIAMIGEAGKEHVVPDAEMRQLKAAAGYSTIDVAAYAKRTGGSIGNQVAIDYTREQMAAESVAAARRKTVHIESEDRRNSARPAWLDRKAVAATRNPLDTAAPGAFGIAGAAQIAVDSSRKIVGHYGSGTPAYAAAAGSQKWATAKPMTTSMVAANAGGAVSGGSSGTSGMEAMVKEILDIMKGNTGRAPTLR